MGLKTDKRTIDGIEIHVTQFAAMRGFAVASKVAKVVTPVLPHLKGVTMQTEIADLAPAIGELFSRLDENEGQALVRDLLAGACAVRDGQQIPLNTDDRINLAFEGNMMAMLRAALFAAEVNFSDFFAGSATSSAALPSAGKGSGA